MQYNVTIIIELNGTYKNCEDYDWKTSLIYLLYCSLEKYYKMLNKSRSLSLSQIIGR
jgi:hypothetical protein